LFLSKSRFLKNLWLVLAPGFLLFTSIPCHSYYFQGWYIPAVRISKMDETKVYSPVGMGIVTSKAGFRVHPVTGKGDFHSGVDLKANLNDPVYNLLYGYVTRVGYRGNLGVAVEVYHPFTNTRTICGHLNAYSVKPGQWVERGRVIGYAGSTGRSTGVHLHYTVIRHDTNQYVEPMAFLWTVPRYVQAQKIASARIMEQQKSSKSQPSDKDRREISAAKAASKEELPEKGGEEAAPPDPGV
jgi:murein DD-endopeptidase MepM/ murein hydrolase activator NlpD